jgi:hypothetical protein
MDHISNKTVVSLLLVALVVTVIGTVINVNKLTTPQGYSIVGAAVAKNAAIGSEQDVLNYNTLNANEINRVAVILKNTANTTRRATVVGTLYFGEEALLSSASLAKTILPGKTSQSELLLNLKGIGVGEYQLRLETYYDGKLELSKSITIQVIEK